MAKRHTGACYLTCAVCDGRAAPRDAAGAAGRYCPVAGIVIRGLASGEECPECGSRDHGVDSYTPRGEAGDGWVRIGRYDSARRRSTWARIETIEGSPSNGIMYMNEDLVAVEMCSGREGDDAYVRVERGDPSFEGLLGVLCYSIGNVEDSDP